jgi:hypothetical protein
MHIILGILALLGGGAFWWWRLKAMSEAAGEINDAAGRLIGTYKRKKFLKKVGESPLAAVDDPAAAAVIMMFAIAKEEAPITDAIEAVVKNEVITTMKIEDTTELLTFSKWVISHVVDANNVSLRYGKLWQGALSISEREDFAEMVERVAQKCGGITTNQRNKIIKLRGRLGLQVN